MIMVTSSRKVQKNMYMNWITSMDFVPGRAFCGPH